MNKTNRGQIERHNWQLRLIINNGDACVVSDSWWPVLLLSFPIHFTSKWFSNWPSPPKCSGGERRCLLIQWAPGEVPTAFDHDTQHYWSLLLRLLRRLGHSFKHKLRQSLSHVTLMQSSTAIVFFRDNTLPFKSIGDHLMTEFVWTEVLVNNVKSTKINCAECAQSVSLSIAQMHLSWRAL